MFWSLHKLCPLVVEVSCWARKKLVGFVDGLFVAVGISIAQFGDKVESGGGWCEV